MDRYSIGLDGFVVGYTDHWCLTWRSTSLPSVAGRCAIKPRSAG